MKNIGIVCLHFCLHFDQYITMNSRTIRSLTARLSSAEGIGDDAVEWNTPAQRCNQEIRVGFEPRNCQFASGCLIARPPGIVKCGK